MTAYDRLIDALLDGGSIVENDQGEQAMAQCPAHNDHTPSLSVRSVEGQALAHCFAGCQTVDVLEALDLTMADLYDEARGARYDYTDASGATVLRSVHRKPPKEFSQSVNDKTVPLYRLPKVVAAVELGVPIYLVEGEKDVHAVESVGGIATTAPMGAGNFGKADSTPLHGGDVIAIVDRDAAGDQWAAAVRDSLDGKAQSLKFVRAKVGKDVADHVAARRGLDKLAPYEPSAGDPEKLAEMDAAAAFATKVAQETDRLRVRQAAQELLTAERSGGLVLPAVTGLATMLATPDPEVSYRVDRLLPIGGRGGLSAQYKAGKTTMLGELLRSLVDGVRFLDAFDVIPASRVVLVDNELDERMLRRWLRDHDVGNVGKVDVVTLRGRASTFNILDPTTRTRWAEHIGRADVILFDCLRPALDALGLSEDKDAGRFLEAFDELTCEAGISESLVVHHMGHTEERSRGDSRILDWPDVIWKIVKQEKDAEPLRYFSAFGRDVDQPEVQLLFNPFDRHLVVGGGSRRDAKASQVEGDVMAFVGDNPGCSQTAIERLVMGDRMTIRKAAKHLAEVGRIRVEKSGQTRKHWLEDADE